jgi:hypothetical protein
MEAKNGISSALFGATDDNGGETESVAAESRKGAAVAVGGDATVVDRELSLAATIENVKVPPTGCPSADTTCQEIS